MFSIYRLFLSFTTISVMGASALAELNLPVIMRMEKRDKLIIVKASPLGPLYTIKSKSGRTLIQDASEKDFLAKNPGLHRFVKRAIASEKELSGS